jgi:hypothetical protein
MVSSTNPNRGWRFFVTIAAKAPCPVFGAHYQVTI